MGGCAKHLSVGRGVVKVLAEVCSKNDFLRCPDGLYMIEVI